MKVDDNTPSQERMAPGRAACAWPSPAAARWTAPHGRRDLSIDLLTPDNSNRSRRGRRTRHGPVAAPLSTPRLALRGWQLEDAPAALEIYGHPNVARWLSPAMDRVADLPAMRQLLGQWIAQDTASVRPAGRWVIQQRVGDRVIGGVFLLPLPPGDQDLQIGWQLHPNVWGRGYATETTHALAAWAFTQGVDEVFAVVGPGNIRAEATVRRNGMEWVGVTDKYFGTTLHVYRLRPADLGRRSRTGCPAPPPTNPAWGKDQ